MVSLKLMPLSIGLLIFALVGAKRSSAQSARRIVRTGQIVMAVGALFVLTSIEPELGETTFWIGLFLVGSGFGLLSSQLGNVTSPAVDEKESAEVGGSTRRVRKT